MPTGRDPSPAPDPVARSRILSIVRQNSLLSYYQCSRLALRSPRVVLPLVTVLLLIGIAGLVVPSVLHFTPRVHAANRTISLIGNYLGWNYSSSSNPTLTVTQGDVITIQLTSVDTTHQFALDVDKDGTSFMGSCPTSDTCSAAFNPSSATSITITASYSPGTYTYFCTFHPAMVGSFIVQPPPPDFSVTSNPSSLTFLQGSSSTSTITVTSQNGFSGTISLSAMSSSPSLTASLKPPSVTVSPGTPVQTSILSVNSTTSTPTGSYTITVTGTSGTLPHSTTLSVTIVSPSFALSANPSSMGVIQGSAGNMTTITITSLHGFAGTISLSATPSQSGLATTFSPPSVTIPSGGSGTSIMSVSTYSTPAGFYTITVNGTSGSIKNATVVSITVTVPDFRLNPSPFSLSFAQGSMATTTITIMSLSGFKGALTLTGIISPSGPSVSFSPASVTVPSGGTITSVMTVSTSSSVAAGSYMVRVTVTNGTLTHSTTVPVTIGSNGSSFTITILIGAGVGAAAIIGVAVLLLRRRSAMKV